MWYVWRCLASQDISGKIVDLNFPQDSPVAGGHDQAIDAKSKPQTFGKEVRSVCSGEWGIPNTYYHINWIQLIYSFNITQLQIDLWTYDPFWHILTSCDSRFGLDCFGETGHWMSRWVEDVNINDHHLHLRAEQWRSPKYLNPKRPKRQRFRLGPLSCYQSQDICDISKQLLS